MDRYVIEISQGCFPLAWNLTQAVDSEIAAGDTFMPNMAYRHPDATRRMTASALPNPFTSAQRNR